MSDSLFVRLISDQDKRSALEQAIDAIREDRPPGEVVQLLNPSDFRQVPASPFAYWVSDGLRRKFRELSPLEGEGRAVKQGVATADDFRFVRAWWEVAPWRVLDGTNGPWRDLTTFQSWCRLRTHEDHRWAPFAKGGEYSPYYADIHLLLNWGRWGSELRAFERAFIRNSEFYFRPGLTWPLRTQGGLSLRALPAGCAFSHKGPAAFVPGSQLLTWLGVTNSAPFFQFVSLQMAFGSYEVGVLQRTPVPNSPQVGQDRLAAMAAQCIDSKRQLDATNEVSHAFAVPSLLLESRGSLAERGLTWGLRVRDVTQALASHQQAIDDAACELYGISAEDRRTLTEVRRGPPASGANIESDDDDESERPDASASSEPRGLVASLISYSVGCAFGRWDVRMGLDSSLAPKLADPFAPLPICSPGMLIGPDGLPAQPNCIVSEQWLRARPNVITPPTDGSIERPTISDTEYPLELDLDGILTDDLEHRDDIMRRVRNVLDLLWGERAVAVEQEACEVLGVRQMREYFGRPSLFFGDHLKRYSKSRRQAPIYWPLSTASGSYTLWVYYHRLTSDTLYTAVNRYVQPKIAEVSRELDELGMRLQGAAGREASRLRETIEQLSGFVRELSALRDELLRIAGLPYRPNLDDGVIINAAPLHALFRLPKWAKDTRETWAKLERGDYDWANLAYAIWPERVRDKCRTDRSLAIAHDLENLYVEPPASAKRGRGRKALAPVDEGGTA